MNARSRDARLSSRMNYLECRLTGPQQVEHGAPPQGAERRGRRSVRRLRFAARPDQVVRAVLVLDQAGVDRCRK